MTGAIFFGVGFLLAILVLPRKKKPTKAEKKKKEIYEKLTREEKRQFNKLERDQRELQDRINELRRRNKRSKETFLSHGERRKTIDSYNWKVNKLEDEKLEFLKHAELTMHINNHVSALPE